MLYTEKEVDEVTAAVIELGGLALAFGQIDRTGPQHPTGEPESDTDHTVMLAWIAPALADLINTKTGFARHNIGKVTQYAVVHDAVEVYAGDTPTVRITEEELQDKEVREAEAAARLIRQFAQRLPWFAQMVRRYELQSDMDARFVRAVDKLMPKIVHVVCAGRDLVRSGFTRADFDNVVKRQRQQIKDWCPDQLLLAIYDRVGQAVRDNWPDDPSPPAVQPVERHWTDTSEPLLRHTNCSHEDLATCPFTLAWQMCADNVVSWPMKLVCGPLGEYELALDGRGLLTVKEKI